MEQYETSWHGKDEDERSYEEEMAIREMYAEIQRDYEADMQIEEMEENQ